MNHQELIGLFNQGKAPKFVFFWEGQYKDPPDHNCLSQFYQASFSDEKNYYKAAEYYMMYKKAELFDDKKVLNKVLTVAHPREAKALGRKVKNFDPGIWDEHKRDIVFQGNCLKFDQNPKLGAYLLSTGEKILVEASPLDLIWGIGFQAIDAEACDPNAWRGQNLLGFELMRVRNWLKKKRPAGNGPEEISSS